MTEQDIIYGVSRYNNINGVTCYMNSILSILQQTPIFADYIVTGSFKDITLKKYEDKNLDDSIIFQLYNLFKISMSNDNFTITPKTFRNTITLKDSMWGEQQHQDSQEFLSNIIDYLCETSGNLKEYFIYYFKTISYCKNSNNTIYGQTPRDDISLLLSLEIPELNNITLQYLINNQISNYKIN